MGTAAPAIRGGGGRPEGHLMDDKTAAPLDRDPDPMAAFAPAVPELDRWAAPGTAPPIEPEQGEAAPLAPSAEIAPQPAPAPAEPRPAAAYIGKGGERRYRLLYPVKIEGRAIRMVTVSHPTLWDVQDWIAGRIKTNFEIMARVTAMPEVELGALKWPDVQALITLTSEVLPDFIRDAIEAAGGTPKPPGAA